MKNLMERAGAKEMAAGVGLFVLTSIVWLLAEASVLEENPGLTQEKIIDHIYDENNTMSGAESAVLYAIVGNMLSAGYFLYGAGKGALSWFRK